MRSALVVATMLVVVGCGTGDAPPEALRGGRDTYADRCSTCHGSSGQGGAGPAFDDVLAVWSDCSDQQRWISLGSERWSSEVGPEYGDTDRPITGVMPGHGDELSDREIAEVAAYVRVQYGGGDLDTELAACGLPPSDPAD